MTHDPVSQNYVPAYEDVRLERERLERCLQQQIEDCFTTISRIQNIAEEVQHVTDRAKWKTLREGLRCWRAAIRSV